MTRVGLVGGLGPESTIDYYRRILAAWEARHPGSSPSIMIDSLDVQVGLRLVAADHKALAAYLTESVHRLAAAGVDFVAMTANTAHIVFEEVAAAAPVPLLSIVETCLAEAQERAVRRAGLLGTRFTMEAPFYPNVFARHGIEVFAPTADERSWIHDRYVNELLRGDFREGTRIQMIQLVERLRDRHALDAVILAGTELPLLLSNETIANIAALDTTQLHVAAIVHQLTKGSPAEATP